MQGMLALSSVPGILKSWIIVGYHNYQGTKGSLEWLKHMLSGDNGKTQG